MSPMLRYALAGLLLLGTSAAEAQSNFHPNVLSAADVKAYRAAFAAAKTGVPAKTNEAIAKIKDASLVGYVEEERVLARKTRAKFADLKSWLERYGDLAGADDVFAAAIKRAPRHAGVPAPQPVRWRGAYGEGAAFGDTTLSTDVAKKTSDRLHSLERDGKPEDADALLRQVAANPALPQSDADKLTAYVAAAYLAEAKDQQAVAIAEEAIARGSMSAPQCHWVAGLASYRLGQFDAAAQHFEAVTQSTDSAYRTNSGAAFWAARSWMHAGHPERVLALYARAAEMPDTFYGMLAVRLLGQDLNVSFQDPVLDPAEYKVLAQNESIRRAVALAQLGRADQIEFELARAFGQISGDLDPAFAALARELGATAIELRAAETSTERNINLSSLYPVPPYAPEGGYSLDEAMILAFAKQESRFNPSAVSPAGARGLMQIMPATAAIITHDSSLAGKNKSKLDNPRYSLTLGQTYLQDILEKQNGNLFALAAAYNAGAGNLTKWMAAHETRDDPLLFIESVPAPETREYVKRVMVNLWMYRIRLGGDAEGLDDTAAGRWPIYKAAAGG